MRSKSSSSPPTDCLVKMRISPTTAALSTIIFVLATKMPINSIALLTFFCVLVSWAWNVFNWIWLRPKRLEKCLMEQGFSGNPYRIWNGDMKEIVQMSKQAESRCINNSDDIVPRVLPFLNKSIKKYGKSSFVWLGPIPRVNIMDPEQVTEIFSRNFDYPKPHINPLTKLLANGLASLEGETWARHRKILRPAFHLEKLKHMLPAFHLSSIDMLSKWEDLMSSEGTCELDVWPYIEKLSGDVIARTSFGSSYEEGRRMLELLAEQEKLLMKALESVYIPGWRFLPTKLNKEMKSRATEIKYRLQGIITKREKGIKAGETPNTDILGILLESNRKEIRENNANQDVGMSIDEVIEECKSFYLAGQTTKVLLVWTIVLLSKYQEWQVRARDEVLQVFGKEKPHFGGLSQLKVMTMIFNEVLRLYPAAADRSRITSKDMKLGNLKIPAGVLLGMPQLLIHHDRELWGDDAKDFKPERFSEGVSKATKGQGSFFPFGYGPRICIGQNFALTEAKVAMAMLLQRYSFTLSPSYTHAPHALIILQPQFGARIVLHKLKQKHPAS